MFVVVVIVTCLSLYSSWTFGYEYGAKTYSYNNANRYYQKPTGKVESFRSSDGKFGYRYQYGNANSNVQVSFTSTPTYSKQKYNNNYDQSIASSNNQQYTAKPLGFITTTRSQSTSKAVPVYYPSVPTVLYSDTATAYTNTAPARVPSFENAKQYSTDGHKHSTGTYKVPAYPEKYMKYENPNDEASFRDLYEYHPDTYRYAHPEKVVPLNVFGLPPKHRYRHPVGIVESSPPVVVHTNAYLPGPVVDSGVTKGSGHHEDGNKFHRLYEFHPGTQDLVNPERNTPLNVFGLPPKHRYQSPYGNVNSFRPQEVASNAYLPGPVVDVTLRRPNLSSSFSGRVPTTGGRYAEGGGDYGSQSQVNIQQTVFRNQYDDKPVETYSTKECDNAYEHPTSLPSHKSQYYSYTNSNYNGNTPTKNIGQQQQATYSNQQKYEQPSMYAGQVQPSYRQQHLAYRGQQQQPSYGQQQRSYSGQERHSYGQERHSYGQQRHSYGQQPSYSKQQSSYSQQQSSYSQQQSSYGQQQSSYDQQQSPYGKQHQKPSNGQQQLSYSSQQKPYYGQQQSSHGQQQSSYGQQQPTYGQQQSTYGQQQSSYGKQLQQPSNGQQQLSYRTQQQPSYGQQQLSYSNQQNPSYGQQQPSYGQQQLSYSSQQKPSYGQQQYYYGQQQSNYGQQQPSYAQQQQSSYRQQQSSYGKQQSSYGQQQSSYGQQQSSYGQQQSSYGQQQSSYGQQQQPSTGQQQLSYSSQQQPSYGQQQLSYSGQQQPTYGGHQNKTYGSQQHSTSNNQQKLLYSGQQQQVIITQTSQDPKILTSSVKQSNSQTPYAKYSQGPINYGNSNVVNQNTYPSQSTTSKDQYYSLSSTNSQHQTIQRNNDPPYSTFQQTYNEYASHSYDKPDEKYKNVDNQKPASNNYRHDDVYDSTANNYNNDYQQSQLYENGRSYNYNQQPVYGSISPLHAVERNYDGVSGYRPHFSVAPEIHSISRHATPESEGVNEHIPGPLFNLRGESLQHFGNGHIADFVSNHKLIYQRPPLDYSRISTSPSEASRRYDRSLKEFYGKENGRIKYDTISRQDDFTNIKVVSKPTTTEKSNLNATTTNTTSSSTTAKELAPLTNATTDSATLTNLRSNPDSFLFYNPESNDQLYLPSIMQPSYADVLATLNNRRYGYNNRNHYSRYHNNRGYGNRGYGNRGYGNRGYGNRDYGNHDYGNRGYSNRDYGNRNYGDDMLSSIFPKVVKIGLGLGITKEFELIKEPGRGGYHNYNQPQNGFQLKVGAGPFIEKKVLF